MPTGDRSVLHVQVSADVEVADRAGASVLALTVDRMLVNTD